MLTYAQRQRLMDASSKVFGEKRYDLYPEALESVATRINNVLLEIHRENPHAFITKPNLDHTTNRLFDDIEQLLAERNFYHQPQKVMFYKSFVKPIEREEK